MARGHANANGSHDSPSECTAAKIRACLRILDVRVGDEPLAPVLDRASALPASSAHALGQQPSGAGAARLGRQPDCQQEPAVGRSCQRPARRVCELVAMSGVSASSPSLAQCPTQLLPQN